MELLSVIRQFNWVDILVVIILLRISYIAVKSGLSAELFKLMGVIMAIYLSMHYYTFLSDFLKKRLSEQSLTLGFLDLFSFLILVILGYVIFMLLGNVLSRFIKLEAVPKLNKWGGFILGIVRAILVVSLVMFMLVISNIVYLKNSVNHSYSGKCMFGVAPATYSALWNNLASKFMTEEKFNKTVLEVQTDSNP